MATRKTTRKNTRKTKAKSRAKTAPVEDLHLVESANQIWMAGVGALSRAQKEGPKVFDNLVREGVNTTRRMRSATEKAIRDTIGSVQGAVESRVDSARSQASMTIDNVEKIVQTRVHRALHQLGVPTSDEVTALTRKVNELNRNVEELIATRKAKTRRRANGAKARGRTARTARVVQ
jgi:poly(hydroxyalkanoate) granule-associated protein